MTDDASNSTSTQTLQQLEESRHFLQQLVQVAGVIEGLKLSLEHMLADGLDDTELEPYMARLVERLRNKVRGVSDQDLMLSLEKLDRRLRAAFVKLSPFIGQVESGEDLVETLSLTTAVADVASFKRQAQTVLAMRGVLTHRGLAVPEFRLPLDRDSLVEQLHAVIRQEQSARRAVVLHIRSLGGEIQQMLKRTDLPQSMHDLMQQLLLGLRENMEHLKAGRSISDLPLAIEAVSFVEAPPQPERSTEVAIGTSVAEEVSDATSNSVLATASEPTDRAERPPSLLRAVWLWIGSPWQVSWHDVRSGRYRR